MGLCIPRVQGTTWLIVFKSISNPQHFSMIKSCILTPHNMQVPREATYLQPSVLNALKLDANHFVMSHFWQPSFLTFLLFFFSNLPVFHCNLTCSWARDRFSFPIHQLTLRFLISCSWAAPALIKTKLLLIILHKLKSLRLQPCLKVTLGLCLRHWLVWHIERRF